MLPTPTWFRFNDEVPRKSGGWAGGPRHGAGAVVRPDQLRRCRPTLALPMAQDPPGRGTHGRITVLATGAGARIGGAVASGRRHAGATDRRPVGQLRGGGT